MLSFWTCAGETFYSCRDDSVDVFGFLVSETTEQKLASPVVITPMTPRVVTETISYTVNYPKQHRLNVIITIFRCCQYAIWFASKPTANDTVTLAMISPSNTTFYQAMVQASDIDPRFGFEAHEWPNGHYIHTIGDKQEDPSSFNYWLLYKLLAEPDPSNPPGNEFIKSVKITDS